MRLRGLESARAILAAKREEVARTLNPALLPAFQYHLVDKATDVKTTALLLIAFAFAAADSGAVDFDTEVMPVLSKAGCNAAACHGAAAGRGGFKLSLFGGDPQSDYDAIVRELEGRRVNHLDPAESLLVRKPSGEMDHEGGTRFDPDSRQAAVLVDWIQAGASREMLRKLVRVEVTPSQYIAERIEQPAQLRVVAYFDDGTTRDVTNNAIYEPGDPAAIEVTDNGTVRVTRRGRHIIVVRFLSQVATVEVFMPFADAPIDRAKGGYNWIDDELSSLWSRLRVQPASRADDATLLRRIYLDLTGRLPTSEVSREFLADNNERKFEELVDRLLVSDEFVEFWTFRFAQLLRVRAAVNETVAAAAFHDWIRQQIADATPWDELVTTLLVAEGDSHEYGPANFYRLAGGAREQAEYASETLMGVRLRCANCHNHPLDRWTQDDYHGLAAVFARVERGRVVRISPRGEVSHPRTGKAAIPKIPGEQFIERSPDPRRDFATWLTSAGNPYLARATVNRLWHWLMGRGLVEPVDDLRQTNPAVHPQLLDRLAEDFVEHKFDLRHTIRLIVTAAAYQSRALDALVQSGDPSAAQETPSATSFFSQAIVKQLDAEVLADAIADVTGVPERYDRIPIGTRAITLPNPGTPSTTLDILGRCPRDTSCEVPAVGLATRLHLINGEVINTKVSAETGRLHRMVQAGRTDREIICHFYLTAFCRHPSDKEMEHWCSQFSHARNQFGRLQQLEDFLWALLASREFITNH